MKRVVSQPAADVLVVGRANVDLTVRVPRRPQPGMTVFGSELATTPGGKALNQAVAVARLGGRAALVANVGDDQWGQMLKAALQDAEVDVTHLQLVQGAPTGAAIIEVTPDAENYLVLAISPGTELTAQQVDTAIARANATVIVTQLDLPPEPVTTALAQSRPQTLRIGNLVPHPALDTSLLRYLDVLVVNQHEASTILNVDDVDPQAAADQLRRLGPSAAVVTTGARGAAYSHHDRSGTVAAPKVPATDTTGAGDAFLGSLALDLANNVRLADAISRAVQVGTEAVQHQGALLPPLLAPHNAAGSDTGGIAGMEPDAKASPRSKS